MEEESKGELEKIADQFKNTHKIDIKYFGIGKINATYQATKSILEYKYNKKTLDLLVNIGSAGGNVDAEVGEIVQCTSFMQIDYDTTLIGSEFGAEIFGKSEDDLKPIIISNDILIDKIKHVLCGTSDKYQSDINATWRFDKNAKNVYTMEMEAYALAKVCKREKIPFVAIKFISDKLTTVFGNSDDFVKSMVADSDVQKKIAGGLKLLIEQI